MKLINITRTYWYALLIMAAVEVASLCGWNWPFAGKIFFWLLVGLTCLIAFWRLEIALWIIVAELVIGSKGYLFAANIGAFSVSIRLGLFGAIIIAWLITRLSQRKIRFFKSKIFWLFLAFLAAIGWGIGNGLIRHHPLNDAFLDVNGFLYFGLIFVFYDVIITRARITKVIEILLAGITGLAIKTLLLLTLFAAQVSFLQSLYRWVRDTRVYEVTLDRFNFYRVFSQGQIYSLFGAVIVLTLLAIASRREGLKKYRGLVAVFILATTTIIISYSRSIWLSLALTSCLLSAVLMRKYQYRIKSILAIFGLLLALASAEVAGILILVNLPHWLKSQGTGVSLASLVEERLGNTNEVALQSRWNLLGPLTKEIASAPLLGKGFGSRVEYQSKDPRIVAATGGWYQTYSFEWGYLDLTLKIGLIGLIIYLMLLVAIFKNGYRAYKNADSNDAPVILGLLLALASLIITHATTPYLNHPLGIGFIILCAVVFEQLQHDTSPAKKLPSAV